MEIPLVFFCRTMLKCPGLILTFILTWGAFRAEKMGNWLYSELERVKGIEPSSQAWEARILPLNHTRSRESLYQPRNG